jgi:hypothetical protein
MLHRRAISASFVLDFGQFDLSFQWFGFRTFQNKTDIFSVSHVWNLVFLLCELEKRNGCEEEMPMNQRNAHVEFGGYGRKKSSGLQEPKFPKDQQMHSVAHVC